MSNAQNEQLQRKRQIVTARLDSIKIKKDKVDLNFWLDSSVYQVKSVSLILRSQIRQKQYEFAFAVKNKTTGVKVRAQLSVADVEWEQFYWDIRGVVEAEGTLYELRIKNRSKLKRILMLIAAHQKFLQERRYVVYPYLTNSNDPAIQYRAKSKQDSRWFVLKEYVVLFIYYLFRRFWLSKQIWLVYEKYSITAQDNSYYFFKYCQEKLTREENKNIYYVIDKKAADYQYVKQYGNKVIQFLSLKHMIYLKAAQLLISSDTKAHAYAWHSPNTIYRALLNRNKNVFLQHGVIYYKQCHKGLKKSGTNSCRLFIVSSEVEKKIIKKYFGYKNSEIAVTGLARWDVLQDASKQGEKMILMMPTWRNWLEEVSADTFKNSEYYQNYMALLNDARLHQFLETKQVKMVFYIHPKFREYIGAFATTSPWIELVEFGTQPLNALIMRCNMMVTDYSSACWDVFYQGKPVLFYLFDFELYNQVQGSYVDMRVDAFGEATDSMTELIQMMEWYEERSFKEKEKYAAMRERLLPYRDSLNSERIYQALKKKFLRK